jgi:predicted ABC-type ATPase
MTAERPACIVLAGPNGAGKSTIYKALSLPSPFVNADEVARELNPAKPEAASIRAGRLVLHRLAELIETRPSFTYETTLSSHQSVKLLRDAADVGYQTTLIFVALANPDLHVLRVAQRVSTGGHHIPQDAIRRRYDIAFENLSRCVSVSESTWIFDNSAEGARLVLTIQGGKVGDNYIDPLNPFDRRIAHCVASGLGITVASVLPDAD